MSHGKALGNLNSGQRAFRWCINIVNGPARVAIEMKMLVHVGTIPGRASIEIDLPHESALHQRVQAVVDGGDGDLGTPLFGPDEYLFSGRMIAPLQQDVIDLLPLSSQSEAARGEAFVELIGNTVFNYETRTLKITSGTTVVNT